MNITKKVSYFRSLPLAILPLSLFLISCSLYDDYSPKSGTFCNLQTSQLECIQLDLETHTIQYKKETYPLLVFHRTHFQAVIQNEPHEIYFTSEHRIQWVFPSGKIDYFHREKKKQPKR
jgi:hypothetical protein